MRVLQRGRRLSRTACTGDRRRRRPGAVASLVFGILAFFVCGIIFGLVAIQKAEEAKNAIAVDPSLTGGGMAVTGKVLGIIAIVVWGLGLVLQYTM